MAETVHRYGARLARASAVLLAGVGLLSVTADAAGAETLTTTSVLTAAKSAITKQTSVHLVVTSKSPSASAGEELQADLAKTMGTETISEGTETVVIEVTPTYAYLSGDSSGLTKIVGLSAAEAKKVGKDWVAVKAGTTQYENLEGSLTFASIVSILPPAKGTQLSPAASNKKFYTLKWNTAKTSSEPALSNSLTISAVGAPLPVKETTTVSGGGKETVALSKWGEHVTVSAPPAASIIPLAKVTG